jgi:hypothetical protein
MASAIDKLVVPPNALRSHVEQQAYVDEYDGPWGDGPSEWHYWIEDGQWVGRTTHERHGMGSLSYFGEFHPLTGEPVDA